MKHLRYLVLGVLFVSMAFFGFAADKNTQKNTVTLVSSSTNETILKFDVKSYSLQNAKGLNAKELVAPQTGKFLIKDAPELLKMSAAVIIPNNAVTQIEVMDTVFTDIQNVDLAPSKGNLSRAVNPDTIPYNYGSVYQKDAFYPGTLASLGSPYYIRNHRGQAVIVNPFQYNPVTKVLRVYTSMTVKVSETGAATQSSIVKTSNAPEDSEFENVYARHFVNYQPQLEYTALPDSPGRMLIVCYNGFMTTMAPFVSWKQSIGYTVDLVDYSTIGSAAALKTYVANYYNTNGLTYLLLVGDHAQVPTSTTTAGDSDNNYGYIVGTDKYLDIFVGRFSGETAAQIQTQVDRSIWYERDLLSSATYFRTTIGMASSEGPGHNSEYDATHMDNILTDMAGFGYTTRKNYQSGGTAANLSSLINTGAGAMMYCGHGSDTAWTCGWTFSNTQVAALTNTAKLPFIFSVACVVGNFRSQTCFCESWVRATYNNQPSGAMAICGSTINQDWNPPMDAQDEMIDILVAQGKRTFGGVFVNGLFKMQDLNGTSGQNMADTWVCFGDPSLQIRTPGAPNGPVAPNNPPVANFTSNKTAVQVGGSVAFTDQSTNNPTSWSWTFNGGTPSTSTSQNPTVTYNTAGTYSVTLTATNAYGNNTITKTNYITVSTIQVPVANFTSDKTSVNTGGTVAFTDTSTNFPTSWSWTFAGGTPATSTAQNPTVTYSTAGTYNVVLTATNSAGSNTVTKTGYITVTSNPYCTAASTNCTDEWIAQVQLGTMTNSSGASNYTDFTAKTVNLTRGARTSYKLTPGFRSTAYTEYWKVWIDYNKNGVFTDTSENIITTSGSSYKSGNFTVLSTASTGTTRIRVAMKYSSAPTPCGTFTYGEVEDYTANIQ